MKPLVVLLATAASLAGQEPRFEAASVRANLSGEQRISMGTRGRTFTATNVPLGLIVANAYGIFGQDFRLLGLPGWASERFDIAATVPEGADIRRDVPLMLRALLAERFKLIVRVDTREAQAYALVPARSDGRLSPKIRPAAADCEADPSLNADRERCASQVTNDIMGRGQRMGSLARLVSAIIRRPVVDRTGIMGAFDFDIEIPPPTGPLADAGGGVFTALPEQTGLKLEGIQLPMEFITVVSIERPTGN